MPVSLPTGQFGIIPDLEFTANPQYSWCVSIWIPLPAVHPVWPDPDACLVTGRLPGTPGCPGVPPQGRYGRPEDVPRLGHRVAIELAVGLRPRDAPDASRHALPVSALL